MKNWLLGCVCLTSLIPGALLAQTAATNDTFARSERSVQITDDLTITSLGGFGISDRKVGHIDLVFIESDDDGDTLGIEMGGGFAFKAGLTFYLGAGLLLGYDLEDDGVEGTVYPEIGAAWKFGSFGVIASSKLYARLKGDTEDVVMLGLLYLIA